MAKSDAAALMPGEEIDMPNAPPLPPDEGPAVLGVSDAGVAERDLRDAIGTLKRRIIEARAGGYVVDLPFPETALDAIAISETAKVSA